MNLTLQQTEILEGVHSGAITERYTFGGPGAVFCGRGKLFQVGEFDLVLRRSSSNATAQLGLELRGLESDALAVLRGAVPLPVADGELETLTGANLVLRLKPDALTPAAARRLAGRTDLSAVLGSMDSSGRPLCFEVANYTVADFAGY